MSTPTSSITHQGSSEEKRDEKDSKRSGSEDLEMQQVGSIDKEAEGDAAVAVDLAVNKKEPKLV
jgi:hypothetical protein